MHFIAGSVMLVNTIGIDTTLHYITTLASTTQLICTSIMQITEKNHCDISKFIKESDIITDIIILNSLFTELDANKYKSQTFSICIKLLMECITLLQNDIDEVNKRMEYNESLWFFKYSRSYNFNDLIEKINMNKKTLKNRKKMLFEIINLDKSINIKQNIIILDEIKDENISLPKIKDIHLPEIKDVPYQ